MILGAILSPGLHSPTSYVSLVSALENQVEEDSQCECSADQDNVNDSSSSDNGSAGSDSFAEVAVTKTSCTLSKTRVKLAAPGAKKFENGENFRITNLYQIFSLQKKQQVLFI